MKTIRTIIATLAVELLAFALVAWSSVRRNAAFIQRTIYQGFDQTFVVALVMGSAFLLIAIILTVAIVSTDGDEDEEDEEEDEAAYRPRRAQPKTAPQRRPVEEKRPVPQKAPEQPYRRVTRDRTMDQPKPAHSTEEVGFARPRAKTEERPALRKQERTGEEAFDRDEVKAYKPRRASRPAPLAEENEFMEVQEPEALASSPLAEMPQPIPDPPKAPETESEALPDTEPEAPAEPEEAPAEPEEEPVEPEEVPAEPEEAPTQAEEEPVEPEEPVEAPAPAPAPHRAEGTLRCVFCGSTISRDSIFCTNCGKKV